MRPQDPNYPPEIPPVPPPRKGGEADLRDELTAPQPNLSDEAVEGGVDTRGDVEPSPFIAANGAEDLASRDDSLDSVVVYRFSPDSAPDASPNGSADASGQETDRPYTPDATPWTDSDLQDVEDPLPVPTPEPQPTYIDRGRQPNAATSNQNARAIAPAEDVWADTGIPYQPKELGVVDQLLLLLADGVTLWKKGLRWVRSQLPPDLQRQLSDGVLTAIALGLLMLFLALWNPLGAGQSGQVASESPSAEAPVSPAEAYFSEAQPEALSEAPPVDSASNP
ncbi:hypothetical protein IQ273_19285, partial [Nodosilinea sp. LEGE 07298]|uniref:hypothetical protein n=1 Tax=Nodosilinea sp. LEGE 07298 TaxID=2777970 RepID=UPI00188159B5